MKTIAKGAFQGSNDELRTHIEQRVAAFQDALAAHAATVGIPAPRDDDLIEQLARTGEAFEIESTSEPQPELTEEQLSALELERKRSAALRALDEQRLETAIADPDAPQEVKDYEALRATRSSVTR